MATRTELASRTRNATASTTQQAQAQAQQKQRDEDIRQQIKRRREEFLRRQKEIAGRRDPTLTRRQLAEATMQSQAGFKGRQLKARTQRALELGQLSKQQQAFEKEAQAIERQLAEQERKKAIQDKVKAQIQRELEGKRGTILDTREERDLFNKIIRENKQLRKAIYGSKSVDPLTGKEQIDIGAVGRSLEAERLGFKSVEEMQSFSKFAMKDFPDAKIISKGTKKPEFSIIKTGEERISTAQDVPLTKKSLILTSPDSPILPQTVAFEDTALGKKLFKETPFSKIVKDLNKDRKPKASDIRLSRFERFVKAPYLMTPFGAESIIVPSDVQKQRETGASKWISGLTYQEALRGLQEQKFKQKTSASQQRDIDAFIEKLEKTPDSQKYDVYTRGLEELKERGVTTRPTFITDEQGLISTGEEFVSPAFEPSYTFGRYQLKKEDDPIGKALLATRIFSTKATEMYLATKAIQPVFKGIGAGIGKVAKLERGITLYGKQGGLATNLIRYKDPLLATVNIGVGGLYAGTKFKQYQGLTDQADKIDFFAKTGGEVAGVGLAVYSDEVVNAGRKFIKGFKESNRRMMLDKRATMGRSRGRSRTQQKQVKKVEKKKADAYVRQFDDLYKKGGSDPIKDYLKKASNIVKNVKDPDMKTAGRDNLKFFLEYAKKQGYIKGYVLADDGSVAFIGDEGVLFAGATPKPPIITTKPIVKTTGKGLPRMVGGTGTNIGTPIVTGKVVVKPDQPVIWTSGLPSQPESRYIQTPDNIFITNVKTGIDSDTKTGVLFGSASATKIDTGLLNNTLTSPVVSSTLKTESLSQSSTKTDTALASALGLRSLQKPRTTQKQLSSLISATGLVSRPVRRVIRQIEKPTKPVLFFPRAKTQRRRTTTRRRRVQKSPFVTEIKRFGKWKPIKSTGSLAQAIKSGQSRAETTLARSFRVRKGSQLIPITTPQGFRKSKASPFVQVERSRKALSQFGEKSEIAFWRRAKKKKKNIKRKKKKK